jgi:hypothetical protein
MLSKAMTAILVILGFIILLTIQFNIFFFTESKSYPTYTFVEDKQKNE